MDKTKVTVLKILDNVSSHTILVATIFVLLFEYTYSSILLHIALSAYIMAFTTQLVFSSLRIIFAAKIKEDEFSLTKNQKIWFYVKVFMSIMLLIFTIVIYAKW